MGKELIKEICIKYLKKYPDKPILTIAKLIYKDHPGYFDSVEAVRTKLRYYTGLKGKEQRAVTQRNNPEVVREISYRYNPFDDIPKSYKAEAEFYDLPVSCKRILLLSDVHLPYHDEDALRAAINKGVEEQVDTVILNGDILDFMFLSSFEKDPTKPKMKEEISYGKWFVKAIRETFPKANIYYKIGNHEVRLERWLKLKAPEWLGTDEFQLSVLLDMPKHHVQLIEKNTIIRAGNLFILHGHEYKGSGTVNPARNLYLKAKSSAICGHFHRKSEYLTKDIGEQVHGAWTTGCLCELNPEYMPKGNDWVHGCAIIDCHPDKSFAVRNYTIINGKIV